MPRHLETIQSYKASNGRLFETLDEMIKYEMSLILQKHWMDADISMGNAVFQAFDELHELWHARERELKAKAVISGIRKFGGEFTEPPVTPIEDILEEGDGAHLTPTYKSIPLYGDEDQNGPHF